jgi:hypothetical protein
MAIVRMEQRGPDLLGPKGFRKDLPLGNMTPTKGYPTVHCLLATSTSLQACQAGIDGVGASGVHYLQRMRLCVEHVLV